MMSNDFLALTFLQFELFAKIKTLLISNYFFSARGDRRIGATYLFSLVECVDEFDEIAGDGATRLFAGGRPGRRFSAGGSRDASAAFTMAFT